MSTREAVPLFVDEHEADYFRPREPLEWERKMASPFDLYLNDRGLFMGHISPAEESWLEKRGWIKDGNLMGTPTFWPITGKTDGYTPVLLGRVALVHERYQEAITSIDRDLGTP